MAVLLRLIDLVGSDAIEKRLPANNVSGRFILCPARGVGNVTRQLAQIGLGNDWPPSTEQARGIGKLEAGGVATCLSSDM